MAKRFNTSNEYNLYKNAAIATADELRNKAYESGQKANNAQNRYNSLLDESYNKSTYKKSDAQIKAEQKLNEIEENTPKEYKSKYDSAIEKMYNRYGNHMAENFNYNINYDPLYKQYAEQYTRNAKKAMNNSTANASAYTGGYGSTYAQTAGSLAYNGEIAKLNDKVPELYEQAYKRYKDDGDNMYNRIELLMKLDTADYGKYRDNVDDYFTFLKYYNNKYENAQDFDYKVFAEEWKQYESLLNYSQKDYQYEDRSEKDGEYKALKGYEDIAANQFKADVQSYNSQRDIEKAEENAKNQRNLAILKAQLTGKTSGSSKSSSSNKTQNDETTSSNEKEPTPKITKKAAISMVQTDINNEIQKNGVLSEDRLLEIVSSYKTKYNLDNETITTICINNGVELAHIKKYFKFRNSAGF